ncbi:MAG: hemolysin III family protein [Roseovarius sp.]|nr:hemolysin III family protein [Roseovarius sp.]
MSYPEYCRAERIADGVVHVFGISAAMIGIVVLFTLLEQGLDWGTYTATAVYAAALLLMLSASGAYHILAHTKARPILRRIDHAAIYVKIAGTFTPLSMILGTGFGYVILGLVWLLALIGASAKLMAQRGQIGTGWMPYFLLGAAGVLLFVPLAGVVSMFSLILLALGGILYTAGILFYCSEKLRYANAIWHIFVLLASASFFMGISTALAQAM